MGGAACWQFAVHFPTFWAAAAPGAGFSETPEFLGSFQRVQYILGLAGLADENSHVIVIDCRRILGDELRSKDRDRGATCELCDIDRAHRRGVIARAAPDQIQMTGVLHLLDQWLHLGTAVQ